MSYDREVHEPPHGWLPFGSLIDHDGPTECSEETGLDGLPLWERPCPHDHWEQEGDESGGSDWWVCVACGAAGRRGMRLEEAIEQSKLTVMSATPTDPRKIRR